MITYEVDMSLIRTIRVLNMSLTYEDYLSHKKTMRTIQENGYCGFTAIVKL